MHSPGLEAEGIFRLAGSKRAVTELAARIDKEGQAEPALAALSQSGITESTVHIVAACLKRFLVRAPPHRRMESAKGSLRCKIFLTVSR